jgi:putative transposase
LAPKLDGILSRGESAWGNSPDLNPIEQVFAKIKGFVRKAGPRTLDGISQAIAQALATIPPVECQNYLAGAGYASA